MRDNEDVGAGRVERGEVQILEEHRAWANPLAEVRVARVLYPPRQGGDPTEAEQFRLTHAPGHADGVVSAPVDERDRVVLVRQFRHPVRMWMRELPRGGAREGEAPEDAARRELKEELGCEADLLLPLGRIATDSGQQTGRPWLFAARIARCGAPQREATEDIAGVVRYTFDALRRACQRGEIADSFTLATCLRLEPHFTGDRFTPLVDPPPAPGDATASGA